MQIVALAPSLELMRVSEDGASKGGHGIGDGATESGEKPHGGESTPLGESGLVGHRASQNAAIAAPAKRTPLRNQRRAMGETALL